MALDPEELPLVLLLAQGLLHLLFDVAEVLLVRAVAVAAGLKVLDQELGERAALGQKFLKGEVVL